jgi:hypothetical protein
MNTISLIRTMNTTFKRTQLLPTLLPEMTAAGGELSAFYTTGARTLPESRPKTARKTDRRLPLPQADRNPAEQALFAILVACVVFCAVTTIAMLIEMSPPWSALQTWIARVVG